MAKLQTSGLVCVLLVTALAAGAEKPPWQRQLEGDDAKKAAELEKRVGELEAAGKFAEAVAPAEELFALRRRVQGEDHWQAADARRQVETLKHAVALPAEQQRRLAAEAYGPMVRAADLQQRGKYAEAEPLLRQALAASEQLLGPRHAHTGAGYNNLALNLGAQGKPAEAEPFHRKAVAVCEQTLGPHHPSTATSLLSLAIDLDVQSKPAEAEPLHRRALAVFEEALGPHHPSTAQGYGHLADNLDQQGKHAEAEPLHRKALAVYEEARGERHPDTAAGYNNLAYNLDQQGKHAEAEPLHRKALAIYEAVRGARHPETAISSSRLADNLGAQGKYAEAEPLLRQALAIFERALGPRHPYTATSSTRLAGNLDRQGKYAEAEPLFRQALAVYEQAPGPPGPDTAAGYNNLAVNLGHQGKHAEAEPLFRKAVAFYERALGPRHPHTAQSYNNLADNFDAWGKYAEAEPLHRHALDIDERALGPRHPDTAQCASSLAVNLDRQGKHAEAEPLLRQALAVREQVLGPRHPDTAAGYNDLAANLDLQGKHAEAERFWRAAVAAFEVTRLRSAATGFQRAVAARRQPHLGLALCLARQGKAEEAAAAAEDGLARGLLDDLAARTSLARNPAEASRLRRRAARLDQLDGLLVPLLAAEKLAEAEQRRRDALARERAGLLDEIDREAAQEARGRVLPLERIRKQLPADAALVFWVDGRTTAGVSDRRGWHWGCVLRRSGPPAWVRLPGSGPDQAWNDDDDELPGRLGEALAGRAPGWDVLARRLREQRLDPLRPLLAATADLPAARRLVVVPAGWMAGVPLEALGDAYAVSYAPSGTMFARLAEGHRPLRDPTLLALGDPDLVRGGGPTPPPPLPAVGRGSGLKPLPGTRHEVRALAALFPEDRAQLLLGSEASEQRLDQLAGERRLKDFRVLHFATHGLIDPAAPLRSALVLADDGLPDAAAQVKAGKRVYTGRLTAGRLAGWELDADLVVLSACDTGLGKRAGGDGYLGFSQVLFQAGARSLVLSLWEVDDTATALLMTRFYEDLLGKRPGLKAPLGRAAALREAQAWLRGLSRPEAEMLTAKLTGGELRGTLSPLKPPAPAAPGADAGDRPYAHPFYWSAFVLLGDPD